MAVTTTPYNHTRAKLLDLGMVAQAAYFYVELLDATATFVATATTKTAVDNAGAKEVYGGGWTQGGENLENVAVSVVDTNGAMLDCDDVSVIATGGPIGPAEAALVWLDEGGAGTTKTPLWFIDFGGTQAATETEPFEINISSNGLYNTGVCP
jgi:hypothetical protein